MQKNDKVISARKLHEDVDMAIFGMSKTIAEFHSLIDEQMPVNRCIPCSERLPEPLQNVLVCTDIKTVTVAWINGDCWHFADTGNGRIEFYGFDEVTHWMPLPEPPEVNENA